MPEVPWFKLFKGWGKRQGTGVTAPLLTDGASDASEISESFFMNNEAVETRSKKLGKAVASPLAEAANETTSLLR